MEYGITVPRGDIAEQPSPWKYLTNFARESEQMGCAYCVIGDRLEAGMDLFGTWLVEITYGRIGTRGRRLRYVAGNEAEARNLVRHSLRRRATAKKRIGVSYRFRELIDPWQWAPAALEENSTPASR